LHKFETINKGRAEMSIKRTYMILLTFLLAASVGCSESTDATSNRIFKSISPVEAQKMMQEKKDLMVVDVRSPQELRNGYIEGSILIPFWEIAKGKRTLPKDKPILLICAVGGRSYGLGQALSRNGWPVIYNLSGGISAWKQAGLPLKY
jgi:rhodanese-related sulfurtransferase